MSTSHIQIISYHANSPPPPYTFLSNSKPHPAPTKALPFPPSGGIPSPILNKNKGITAWALGVRPGSPAPHSPPSPYPRPSITRGHRTSSFTSIRLTSGSFLNILDTPTTGQRTTPSLKDFKADLTAVGYTSVFIPLPKTPRTAALPCMHKNAAAKNDYSHIPIPPIPPSPIKNGQIVNRFRSASLSILRKSTSNAPSSSKPKPKPKPKSKKVKYAHLRPPPLANDLALMQFVDGGNVESNVKRVMDARAKVTANGGVGDVYRDGDGGIWWDEDEEWEYAHLLGVDTDKGKGKDEGEDKGEWVQFGEVERRESVTTVSTAQSRDSDLDKGYIVQPIEESEDLRALGSSLASHTLTQPCPRTRPRRRPAPLKLTPPSPVYKRASNSPSSAKRDFLASSFAPTTTREASKESSTVTVARRGVMRKASVKNVKAFFMSAK